jgi:hypothetical protein
VASHGKHGVSTQDHSYDLRKQGKNDHETCGAVRIWIEPGLAEAWLPQALQLYTVTGRTRTWQAVLENVTPGDGGLWLDLVITGTYS